MTITITHNHAEGTLVEGTGKGDGNAIALKAAGFRWSPMLSQWYVRGSRDHDARQHVIDHAVQALRLAGFTVEVEIDDTRRAAAERAEDQVTRAADRAAALEAKADRLDAKADAADAAGRKISDGIPMGQPILVGHSSEGRHRRDLAKINKAWDTSVLTSREADETRRRAAAARANAAPVSAGQMLRKVATLEAEARDVARKISGEAPPGRAKGAWAGEYAPATGAYADRLAKRAVEIEDDLTYLRETLAASGAKVWGPADFVKGDRVRCGWGLATVERVNPKSLTIRSDIMPQVTNTLGYDKVRGKVEQEVA